MSGMKTQTQTQTPVELIEIDLQDLYRKGHLNVPAYKILEQLLDDYNLEFEILLNYSPDVGTVYFVDDSEFRESFEKAESWLDELKVIKEYAKKKGASTVVMLYDGYEVAYAALW